MKILDVKSLKVPKKEVKVKILDEEVDVDIYPICGFGLTKLEKLSSDLKKDSDDVEVQEKLVRLAIKNGTKCDDETVDFIIENDMFASMELTQAILEYSGEYNQKKMEESTFAKKKAKN